jgi:hypothetical protein
MNDDEVDQRSDTETRAPRRVKGRMPSGCRTVQVFVPESVHFDLQAQAGLLRMNIPDYVYWLLTRARPGDIPSSASEEGRQFNVDRPVNVSVP